MGTTTLQGTAYSGYYRIPPFRTSNFWKLMGILQLEGFCRIHKEGFEILGFALVS